MAWVAGNVQFVDDLVHAIYANRVTEGLGVTACSVIFSLDKTPDMMGYARGEMTLAAPTCLVCVRWHP